MELGLGRWAERKNGILSPCTANKDLLGRMMSLCRPRCWGVEYQVVQGKAENSEKRKDNFFLLSYDFHTVLGRRWVVSPKQNQVFQCITVHQDDTPTQTGHKNSHEEISKNHKMKRKMFLVIMILFSFLFMKFSPYFCYSLMLMMMMMRMIWFSNK